MKIKWLRLFKGIFWFFFGWIVCIVFIDVHGIRTERSLDENSPRTKGIITDVWETNVSDEDLGPVLAYDFYAANPAFGELRGTSYGRNYEYEVGDSVTVIYHHYEIELARIDGLDASNGGVIFYLLLLLPLFGLVTIFRSVSFRRR
ncbi:MAG: hypothetical protein AAFX87_06650 [Bacteroidota bacterium]